MDRPMTPESVPFWKLCLGMLFILAIGYVALCSAVFPFNNPKANDAAAWMHLDAVFTMKKLPQFQE